MRELGMAYAVWQATMDHHGVVKGTSIVVVLFIGFGLILLDLRTTKPVEAKDFSLVNGGKDE